MTDKDLLKRRIDTYNNLISRLDRITSANYMHIVAGMRCTLKAMIDNNLAIIDSTQENPCNGCTNRKGCITCENGELKETVQKEPVSEELESWDKFSHIDDAIEDYCRYDSHIVFFTESLNGEPLEEADDREQVESAFKAGAQWQKEQFEKNRLKHCNSITNEQAELEQGFIDQHLNKYQRMPTFLDAIEYGMRLQKQQMMKNAVEEIVDIDSNGLACVNVDGYMPGDKIKIYIFKEE